LDDFGAGYLVNNGYKWRSLLGTKNPTIIYPSSSKKSGGYVFNNEYLRGKSAHW
jgi:hypothetical protein